MTPDNASYDNDSSKRQFILFGDVNRHLTVDQTEIDDKRIYQSVYGSIRMPSDETMKRKRAKTMTSLNATVDRQKLANARLRAENKSLREMSTILKDAVRRN